MRAALYARISFDKRKGTEHEGAGVDRQLADGEALAGARGWAVVDRYVDNDRSAFDGAERPEYERLLADMEDGRIDVVIAWHGDRLWRSVLEQQLFLVHGRKHGLKLVVTPGKDFDPADADDEFVQTILTAVAAKESGDKRRRMKRKQLDKAQRGEHHGGRRAFGHTKDRTALVDDEAAAVQDAARRVLAGESIRTISIEWDKAGMRTTMGGRWTVDSVSTLLVQPRLAGLREHHGEVVAAGVWPAIIDGDTHRRLVARAEAKKRGPRVGPARRYLLTGFLRCSKCQSRMYGTAIADRGVPRYMCPPRGVGGCGGITVRLGPSWPAEEAERRTDAVVTEMVLRRIDSPEFDATVQRLARQASDVDAESRHLGEQLARHQAKLIELDDLFADGEIERPPYLRQRQRVRARIEEVRAALDRLDAVLPQLQLVGAGDRLRKAWPSMTLEEQRFVLGAVVDHVEVMPAKPPKNRFDPYRLVPVWRV